MLPSFTTPNRAILVVIAIVLGCGALMIEHRRLRPSRPEPVQACHQREFDRMPLDLASRVVVAACLRAAGWGRGTYDQYYRRAFAAVEGTAWDAWCATSGVRSPIAPITDRDVPPDHALTRTDGHLPLAGPEHRIGREDKAHAAYQFGFKGQGGVAASRS